MASRMVCREGIRVESRASFDTLYRDAGNQRYLFIGEIPQLESE